MQRGVEPKILPKKTPPQNPPQNPKTPPKPPPQPPHQTVMYEESDAAAGVGGEGGDHRRLTKVRAEERREKDPVEEPPKKTEGALGAL